MGLPLPELGPLKDPKRFGFRFHVIVKAKIESCDEKENETILDASEIKQDVFRILRKEKVSGTLKAKKNGVTKVPDTFSVSKH